MGLQHLGYFSFPLLSFTSTSLYWLSFYVMCQSLQDTWLFINSFPCTADPGESSFVRVFQEVAWDLLLMARCLGFCVKTMRLVAKCFICTSQVSFVWKFHFIIVYGFLEVIEPYLCCSSSSKRPVFQRSSFPKYLDITWLDDFPNQSGKLPEK